MSAHTSAPWIAQRDGSVTTESGTEIAHVFQFKNLPLIVAAPELLAACQAQHQAIDQLMAMLIEAKTGFMPTQSTAWPAVTFGSAAILKATRGVK